jgi:hypothetical protein
VVGGDGMGDGGSVFEMKTGGFSGAGGQFDGKPVTRGGDAGADGGLMGAVMGAGGRWTRRFTVIETSPGEVETPS